jgi:hypothetical protein
MRVTLPAPTQYADPLKRITATPLAADLSVMGRTVRVETNSEAVFKAITSLFAPTAGATAIRPQFLWRVVGETDGARQEAWPEMAAFSGEGLRYINLGKRSFFAVDLNAEEAVAFIPEELAADPAGFSSVFVATLFDLTASSLGLVQLSAACVSLHGQAVLLIGRPRSGKTTSTHLAAKLGLEFHSDQATYLDLQPHGLQVWGQFWPPAFREESAEYLPELKSPARSFQYAGVRYLCLDGQRELRPLCPVFPVACVFLERQASDVPSLIALTPAEREPLLAASLSFQDDSRFDTKRSEATRALAKFPAYRLRYGKDPAVAATFLHSLLSVHHSLGAQP